MTRCPCLSGETYDACCAPLHQGVRAAPTAEQLMRSRYSAFALGEVGHLLRTWHPSTRPARLVFDPEVRWVRLEIDDVQLGGPFDDEGTVAFTAHHRSHGSVGEQHETSRFVRVDGSWLYLDGR